jgi:hypothetical protein
MPAKKLETDYLVVGSGAMGMAFTDALVGESNADVVMVDRRHRPGGHWNDAYPFVRLHTPSAWYGVSSLPLGRDTIDDRGLNQGLYELASAAEIWRYFDLVLERQLLSTGRVKYFPSCSYQGDRKFVSLLSGDEYQVSVRKAVVDATYTDTRVPATHKPAYEVAPGVRCVPPNDLVRIQEPPSAYVVVGAGKTAIDVCLWLLQSGVDPRKIQWIKPREPWLANRLRFQPGKLQKDTYEGLALQSEAVVKSETVDEVFAHLSAARLLLRVDERVEPTAYRCATVSEQELVQLRRIEHVVRLGRVKRIEAEQIVLERGSIPADAQRLYVDCTAGGISKRDKLPVFGEGRIVLQSVRVCQPAFSAALIGHVEAAYTDTAAKNAICQAIPYPEKPMDWLRMTLAGTMLEYGWSRDKALREWLQNCRLNLYRGAAELANSDPAVGALMQRFRNTVMPATMKLQQFLEASATRGQAAANMLS